MIFVNLLLTEHDIDCIAAYVREHLRDKANAASATAAVYAGMKGAAATGLAPPPSSLDVNRGGPLPPYSGGGGVSSNSSGIGGGAGQCAAQYFGASDDSDCSDGDDDEDDEELLAAVAAVTVPEGAVAGMGNPAGVEYSEGRSQQQT